jgi:hypothetical protein
MKTILLPILLILSYTLKAQNTDNRATLTVQIDQDFFAEKVLGNDDRNYTQGTSFTYTRLGQEKQNFLFYPNVLLNKLMDANDKWKNELPSSISIGVSAFTPLNIRTYYPEYGDRPYSNVVFLNTNSSSMNSRWKIFSWDLTYGMIGTNVGKEFQSLTHRMAGLDGRGIPLGWHTQIGQGGRPVFMIKNTFTAPVFYKALGDASAPLKVNSGITLSDRKNYWYLNKFNVDMYYGTELAAGYYTYMGGKLGLRIGLIDKRNYAATATSTMEVANKGGIVNDIKKYRSIEAFFFGNFAGRLFARNILLTGAKRFESAYSLDPDFMSTFVADWEWGVCLLIKNALAEKASGVLPSSTTTKILFSFKSRSNEIRNPQFIRTHSWGSLTISFPVGVYSK